jgi:hypothetical protein
MNKVRGAKPDITVANILDDEYRGNAPIQEYLCDLLAPKSIAVITERDDFTGGENHKTFLKSVACAHAGLWLTVSS